MGGSVDGGMTASVFDNVAASYDLEFVESPLGRDLRAIVWERLRANFKAGDLILELNCGTGEDAVWLAGKGIRVVATDVSGEMLKATARKAAAKGVSQMIEVRRLDIARPEAVISGARFDGVFSDFGGLNCADDLEPLATMLAEHVVPGGMLLLVLLGRYCPWEIAWHCLHLQPSTAFRRLRRGGAEGKVGRRVIRVQYPTARSLSRVFAPWFTLVRVAGLGVFLPPTYLAERMARNPRLCRFLGRLECGLAGRFPFSRLGDHQILEFRRAGECLRHGR